MLLENNVAEYLVLVGSKLLLMGRLVSPEHRPSSKVSLPDSDHLVDGQAFEYATLLADKTMLHRIHFVADDNERYPRGC